MTAYQPAVPPPPVDPSGTVVTDLPCRKCAYNLRTLSINSRCPECGTAVGYSAQGDLLRFSDPAWVMNLHRGVVMILSGIAVLIVGGIAAAVLGAMLPRFGVVFATVIQLGGWVLMTVGSWLLTEPDPSGLGEDEYGTARKVIRVTLLIGVANQAIQLLNAGFTLPPPAGAILLTIAAIAALAGVVGFFAQLQYIGKLAQRIPDEHLVRRANFLKYAFAGAYGAAILGGLVVAALARGGAGGGGGMVIGIGCFAGIAMLVLLVFGIMYLFMLDRLRKALKEQAQYALHTWAGSGAAAPAV